MCGVDVDEAQAKQTYEEFDTVLCSDCAAELNLKQQPAGVEITIFKQGPDGPIFQIQDGAPLPPQAIFYGYSRPTKGGRAYQLFTYPPTVSPEELNPKARQALEAGGFTL